MDAMRESWTDERLDDFRADVGHRFDRVDREIRDLRVEMKAGFEKIDKRFKEMEAKFDARFAKSDERFEKFDERFERMHRLIIAVGGSFIATLFVAIIANHL